MARKRKGRPINGVLLVDKAQGLSSNDIVQKVKRIYKAAKAGHTGALDPLATGLLPVCLGEATKFSQFLLDSDKTYVVSAKLGERTDTSDADGELIETREITVGESDIKEALKDFVGHIKQIPSMFSALKHEGKPLYHYARKGITIERPARDICIYSINWRGLKDNILTLEVACSKGTYIRTLIDDLGQKLACGAHVISLRRTALAHYSGQQMHCLEGIASWVEESDTPDFNLADSRLLAMDSPVQSIDKLSLNDKQASFIQHGGFIDLREELLSNNKLVEGNTFRLYQSSNSRFLGMGVINKHLLLQAKRLVVYQ